MLCRLRGRLFSWRNFSSWCSGLSPDRDALPRELAVRGGDWTVAGDSGGVLARNCNPGGRRLPGHRRCFSVRVLRQSRTRLLAANGGHAADPDACEFRCNRRMGKLFPLGGARLYAELGKGESRTSQLPACAPHGARRHGRDLSLVEMGGPEPLDIKSQKQPKQSC